MNPNYPLFHRSSFVNPWKDDVGTCRPELVRCTKCRRPFFFLLCDPTWPRNVTGINTYTIVTFRWTWYRYLQPQIITCCRPPVTWVGLWVLALAFPNAITQGVCCYVDWLHGCREGGMQSSQFIFPKCFLALLSGCFSPFQNICLGIKCLVPEKWCLIWPQAK